MCGAFQGIPPKYAEFSVKLNQNGAKSRRTPQCGNGGRQLDAAYVLIQNDIVLDFIPSVSDLPNA